MKKILCLLLTAACSSQASRPLKIAVGVEAVNIFPYTSNDTASLRIRDQIYDRLIKLDEKGNLVPWLAESWTQPSADTVELTLRSNVMFHSGEPLTMEDVAFSIEKAASAPTLKALLGLIKGAEVSGVNKVLVRFKAPTYLSLYTLAVSGLIISSKKVMLDVEKNSNMQYVGTGPYRFKAWNRGQNILLERNDAYWGAKPQALAIEVLTIPESSVRAIAIENGDVDLAYDIGQGDRERLMKNPKVTFKEAPIPRVEYIGMNTKNPLLADARVRQAVSYALDRGGIINAVLQGAGKEAYSMIPEQCEGYAVIEPLQTRDIAKAKALLKEAGISPGTKVSLMAPPDVRSKTAEVVQASLKDIGLDAEIKVMEFGTFLESLGRGDGSIFLSGWTVSSPTADSALYSLLYSESTGSTTGNFSFYKNAGFDKLLDDARGEFNKEKRSILYRKAQELLYKDLPLIGLYSPLYNVASSPKLDMPFYGTDQNQWALISAK